MAATISKVEEDRGASAPSGSGNGVVKVVKKVSAIVRDIPSLVGMAARTGLPRTLLHFGIAPGDDLLCTAVLRELKKRGKEGVWMMSNFPDLFEGNADVERIVPLDYRYQRLAKVFGREYRTLEYAVHDKEADRSVPTTRHVIAELCVRAGISGQIQLRPYLHLTEAEKAAASWAQGKIVVQSSGLAAKLPMLNKQWYPERLQGVIDQLRGSHEFIQIGAPDDPLMTGTKDLRGRSNKRETAAILANSLMFIGLEGFVMHLARAVDCPSIILLGGRTSPDQFCYGANINLYTPLPCSPCWLWSRCDYDRLCMKEITAAHVVAAVQETLGRSRDVLPVESFQI